MQVDGEVFSEPSSTPQADPVSRHGKQKQASKPHPRQSSRKSQKSHTPFLRVVDPLARTTLHIGKAKSPLLTLSSARRLRQRDLTHRNIVLRACLLAYPPFSPSLSYLDRQTSRARRFHQHPPRPPRRGKCFRLFKPSLPPPRSSTSTSTSTSLLLVVVAHT